MELAMVMNVSRDILGWGGVMQLALVQKIKEIYGVDLLGKRLSN